MKKILFAFLFSFLIWFSASATTQVAEASNYITITIDGVVKWTLPKRGTDIELDGSTLILRYSGIYTIKMEFSSVSSPSTANLEALRVAIKNMLINV